MSGMISELATQAQMKAIIALLIVPLSATMVVADDYQIFTLNAVPGSRQHYSYGALVVNETSAAMYSCLGTMTLRTTTTAVSCSKVATKNGINLPPGPAALSPYSTAQHRSPYPTVWKVYGGTVTFCSTIQSGGAAPPIDWYCSTAKLP